jgi:putative NADH-flavin reductase
MQVTIFGANGRVGRLIVKLALDNGFDVNAFVHKNSDLPDHPKLKLINGDIYDGSAVENSIIGSNVVFSALSSWGTPNKDILSSGIKNIILAMDKNGVKRLVSLTGSDARAIGDNSSAIHRLSHSLINIIAGVVLKDGERHIKLLEASDLDWTVIRSSIMNDRGQTNSFKLTSKQPMPWSTINRGSIAVAMLQSIDEKKYFKKAPFIDRMHK